MGPSVLCKSCKRSDDKSEIYIVFQNSEKKEQCPPVAQMHMSVDYFQELSNSNKKYLSSACLGKKDSCLDLSKSKFINERKSKITDYYELLEVVGEGMKLMQEHLEEYGVPDTSYRKKL